MNREFKSNVSIMPVEDIGLRVDRITTGKTIVRIESDSIVFANRRIGIEQIETAILQSAWPKQYGLQLLVQKEVISFLVPRREVNLGFPFEYEIGRLRFFDWKHERYVIAALGLAALAALFDYFRSN